MEIVFNINYHTKWGESLHIELEEQGKTAKINKHEIAMSYHEGGNWTANFKLRKKHFSLSYKYYLQKDDGTKLPESGNIRVINITESKSKSIHLYDFWRSHQSIESLYETSLFTRVLSNKGSNPFIQTTDNKVFISSLSSVMPQNCVLAVSGNIPELGNWKNQPMIMDYLGNGMWRAELKGLKTNTVQYKLCIYNTKNKEIIEWDNRPNKLINIIDSQCVYITDLPYSHNTDWKGVGVAIPVFSIRTNEGFGVGEFLDLKKMVDWCNKTGISLIQILPINETIAHHSWADSYPYKSISVMALHPIYLNVEALGKFPTSKLEADYKQFKEELNKNESVNYVKVLELKSKFYKAFYDKYNSNVLGQADFKQFFSDNEDWLVPYAVFSCLRDRYKTADFRQWKTLNEFKRTDIEKFAKPNTKHYDDIAIHYYIQYNLHTQLKEAVSYAHKMRVALKGDIPIGISRNSVDAWMEPELFNLNGQAGAPPDDFAVTGQNWGFPTYKWDEMAKDNYKWWKKRLAKMAEYFDAYRIDHILGFFRIWEIPLNAVQGLLGYFKPSLPLSREELREKGLEFDDHRFLKPYIHQWYLHNIFGHNTDLVIDKFLEPIEWETYALKEEFDTQQKIEEYFLNCNSFQKDSEDWVQVRDGLFSLVSEVLFIKDVENGGFHPRIALHSTYSYKALDNYLKDIIDKIYIDYFYYRHENFWREKAMQKLPSIVDSSNMLVCGEDLGMVPRSVMGVMNELGILSLEIQRMPKNSKIEFAYPSNYPYRSVASTSTHDMSTVRGWWEENRDKTQRYFEHILGHKHTAAPEFCEAWIAKEILIQHLYSPAMLVIFPFQDIVATDETIRWHNTQEERINIPSDPKHKWRYRMKQNMEDMLNANEFNDDLQTLFKESGR